MNRLQTFSQKAIQRRLWPLWLILVLYLALHIPHLTAPPLDEHAWRQSDTAAVARNFAEESANIFYPRIDMRNQFSGITGMEFPIYNYSIFLFNAAFGFAHWHGRLLSLLFSAVGIIYFYRLLELRYSRLIAAVGTVTLGFFPLWFYFVRNIQPDAAMVSASIASLYYAARFGRTSRLKDLYIAIALLSLACLIKIPAIFVGIPFLYLLGWKKICEIISWKLLLIAGVIFILPNLLWYAWSAHLSSGFGLGQYYYGELSPQLSLSLVKTKGFWSTLKFYILPFKASTAFVYLALAFGLIYSWARRDFFPLLWFLSIGLFLAIFANKSFFHNYYSLPLIPPIAIIAAVGFDWLYKIIEKESRAFAWIFALGFFASLGWFSWHKAAPLYVVNNPELMRLESIMDQNVPKNDRIITNFGGNPNMLYMSHRKGWSVSEDQLNPQLLKGLHEQGAQFVVRDIPTGVQPNVDYSLPGSPTVFKDQNFLIYKLQ
jgi:4-amino-4-deoxy-L-arabinose transferase-like glycosyltransferase